MAIRPDEFLKKYGFDREDDERDHSLRHNALEHARHLRRPRAGTPHDWAEWERYKREHPGDVEDDPES
ncbi:hypothetical protein [Marinobacter sp. SS8-8]|uniref:hypothetical protein n=1 Tax=Marinobacter sp. SS8-8 TaxID=3050452 RepID=UPI000C4A60D4|nr:hypothetical protein [Marinobacter sp. SS8-8]MAZ06224.1 hypothetical protein [Halomonas sp.]|tara:strand:+ start:60383 stop:60586 length:204 start_codon:yes stop_codon:yes gene_type:complete